MPKGVSAHRNWNQGKAQPGSPRGCRGSLRPSELESRQSTESLHAHTHHESPPIGIGIKAKREPLLGLLAHRVSAHRNWNQGKASGTCTAPSGGVSAHRNWNQGKATLQGYLAGTVSLRPSELESKQKPGLQRSATSPASDLTANQIKRRVRPPSQRTRRGCGVRSQRKPMRP
jgi:hypothetical protein